MAMENVPRRTAASRGSIKARLGARLTAPNQKKLSPQKIQKFIKHVSSNTGSDDSTTEIVMAGTSRKRLAPTGLSMVKNVLAPPPSKYMDVVPTAPKAVQPSDLPPPTVNVVKKFRTMEGDPNVASSSKKVPCRFWSGGSCKYGDSCKFSHQSSGEEGMAEVEAGPGVVCRFWLAGVCRYGDGCKFLHSKGGNPNGNGGNQEPPSKADQVVPGFTVLLGHTSGITGMAYDAKTKLLFTADEEGNLCVWEAGACVTRATVEGTVKCMTAEAGWLFVAVGSGVKAWDLGTNQHRALAGAAGSTINALAADKDTGLLMAGTDDGKIACWNGASGFNGVSNFEGGHHDAVVSLSVAGRRLYSGSRDGTIKVWDLTTGKCLMTPTNGHTAAVTGLLCWEEYLLSCSLDGTIKVWVASAEDSGNLKVTFTLPSGSYGPALGLTGMGDPKGALLVCLYQLGLTVLELPSFEERGVLVEGGAACAVVSTLCSPGFICSGERGGVVKQWHSG